MSSMLRLTLAVLVTAATAEAQWARFRGPDGAGLAPDASPLPAVLDKEKNLAWRCALPPGGSSPCVEGERIYVTGHEDEKLWTIAVDRASGAVVWRRAAPAEVIERHHEIHSPAAPTPTSDGERVYVYFGSFELLCYDLDGKEVWRRPIPTPRNTFGTASSPILAGGFLVLVHDSNEDSFVLALDPETGATTWRTERPGFRSGWSTPAVWRRGETEELLVYGDWWLTAYDASDGSERWSVPGLTDEPIVTPATGDGLVFVTSYNMRTNPEVIGLPDFDELLAELDQDGDGRIDATEAAANDSVRSRHDADGEGDHPLRIFFRFLDEDRDGGITATEWTKLVRWLEAMEHENGILAVRPGTGDSRAEIVWQFPRGVPECPSPLYHDGRVYLVKNGGIATCLDAETGSVHFSGRIGARGPRYASPVAGDGKIYAASAQGVVTVLEAGTELKVLSQNDLGERIMATPALAGGSVYVRTQEQLYAFE